MSSPNGIPCTNMVWPARKALSVTIMQKATVPGDPQSLRLAYDATLECEMVLGCAMPSMRRARRRRPAVLSQDGNSLIDS
jgi:hypothetical protein